MLNSRQGVNVPDVHLQFSALTDKDLTDLDFFLEQQVPEDPGARLSGWLTE